MSNHLFSIGINTYKHKTHLASSIKDCSDIKDVLLEKFDFLSQNVYEIYNEEATNKNIQDTFRNYIKRLTEEDNLIIYYSGHGEFDCDTNTGYWVPYESDSYIDYISNQTIVNYINNLKCKHVVIISDACFSNSLLLNGNFKKTSEYFEKNSDGH